MMPILVTSVVSIVSVPLYFRFLGDEMYAMWFYVGTLTGAFGFMDLGMGVAACRYIGVALGANDEPAASQYWATSHAIVLPMVTFFALVFIAIGVLFGPEWFNVSGEDARTLQWAMIWGGVGLFFSYYGQMWFVLSATHLDFRFLSIIRSSLGIASSLGTLAVAMIFKNTAALLAYAALLGLIQFCILLHRGNTRYALPVRFAEYRWARLKEMLPYTVKTFLQLISGSVLGSADRLLLGRLAPAPAFAAYNVALNIGSRMQNLSQAAMGPIFCNTSRGVGGDATRQPEAIYRDSLGFLFPWYGLVVVWVSVWSEPLVQFWLNENAAMVGQAFPWVVAGCCLSALSNISGAQLGPMNRVGSGLFFSLLSSGLSALMVLGGWYLAGLSGAAAGFLVSRISLFFQDAFVRHHGGFWYDRSDLRLLLTQAVFLIFCAGSHLVASAASLSLSLTVLLAFLSGITCAGYLLVGYLPKHSQ
jgi:O-antigen/teichoic acid export membrane protein